MKRCIEVEMTEKNIKIIRVENEGRAKEFLVEIDKNQLYLTEYSKEKGLVVTLKDEEQLGKILSKEKIVKNEAEIKEFLELIKEEDKENYTLDDFNQEIKNHIEEQKEKLTEKVYHFLRNSTVTWINSSDVFSGSGSPKDYTICTDFKGEQIEFYAPYQMDIECLADSNIFTEKEIYEIYDVYVSCKFYYAENS